MKIALALLAVALSCQPVPVARADPFDNTAYNEATFLHTLGDKGITVQDHWAAGQKGYLVCDTLNSGHTYSDTVAAFAQLSGNEIGVENAFAETAIVFFCPTWRYQAESAQASFPPYARRMP